MSLNNLEQQFFEFECGCRWPIIKDSAGTMPYINIDVNNLPTCNKVFELISTGHTKGIFQLESNLGKKWAKRIKPESDEHMSALGSVLRPGCLLAKDLDGKSMTEHYAMRKNGEEECSVIHEALKDILSPSYDILIYQEQLMSISAKIAGFSKLQVDALRKAVGKKDQQALAKVGQEFLDGCKTLGIVNEEIAKLVWEQIKKSGRYCFNKCISGKEVIKRLQYKNTLTIEEMYKIRNYPKYAKNTGHESLRKKWKKLNSYGYGLSMYQDGRIRPNLIEDIQYAGKRNVFKIILEDNSSIITTSNHKFPTNHGILTVLQITGKTNISLYKCGKYEKTCHKRYNFSDYEGSLHLNLEKDNRVDIIGRKNNPFLLHGEYSKFKQNKQLLSNSCSICNKSKIRLETHHINGDRRNNNINNLKKLCPSCHKKEEYKVGRTKIGEKGYPSYLVRIKDIIELGEEDVYDVTMNAPNHNFILENSNIITCNSHAMSYGLNGYDSAYMKSHVPVCFYANWLYYAKDKAKPHIERRELVDDAKNFDILIETPNIIDKRKRVYTDMISVKYGICDVKGIGEAQYKKFRIRTSEAENKLKKTLHQFNWEEFLLYIADGVSSGFMTNLILVGGFRNFAGKKTRLELKHEYDIWNELTNKEKEILVQKYPNGNSSLLNMLEQNCKTKKEGGICFTSKRVESLVSKISILKKPLSSLEDFPNIIANNEQELLGVPITYARVDGCDLSAVNISCKEFNNGASYRTMYFGVTIDNLRKTTIKNGKNKGQNCAFISMKDSTGIVSDVAIWSEAYGLCEPVLHEDNNVLIQGYKDKKTGNLVVQAMYQL